MVRLKEENNNARMGLRDGVPIGLGYAAVSFAFGLYATSSGLSVIEAIMISLFNLTSAGQMAAVPIIAGGGGLLELAITQLVINMRYSLMSVTLSQRLGNSVGIYDRLLIAFTNTDEIFATAISKEQPLGRKYLFSLAVAPFIGWAAGTALGAVSGSLLPEIIINSLGIALYAMFIAIVVPVAKKSRSVALAVVSAILLSSVFYYLPPLNKVPGGFVIIICAVSVSALFAIVAPINDGEDDV